MLTMLIRIMIGLIAFYLFVEVLRAQASPRNEIPAATEHPEIKNVGVQASPGTLQHDQCALALEPLIKTLETQKKEIEALKRQNEILKTRLDEIWEIINWYPTTTMHQ